VELPDTERDRLTAPVLTELGQTLHARFASLRTISLDPEPYQPGRAFRSDAL